MAACEHALRSYSAPNLSAVVHKEECTQCFDSQDSPEGVNVCLSCYNAGCPRHALTHAANRGHPLVLNIKRHAVQVADTERPQKITRVAIGLPGGAADSPEQYDFETQVICLQCNQEVDRTAGKLPEVIDGIMAAPSTAKQDELKAWENEVTACSHTQHLVQKSDACHLAAKALAHCGMCELSSNLWLCLTCGQLGCGRRNYDGTGGNGHAIDHTSATGHPVVCKLGTITPEGTADIYCYACDDQRLDPELIKHLATFGINVSTLAKTEKSTAELELDQNISLNFSDATEDGQKLMPMFGPSLTGLKNLGNSCYMASVLQLIFTQPEFRSRYLDVARDHPSLCSDNHAQCFLCQMGKIADGLLSGRYSVAPPSTDAVVPTPVEGSATDSTTAEEPKGQVGVAPRMFKSLIGRDHSEFSTMRQQDALEFLQHLLKMTQQRERAAGADPTRCFAFTLQQRLECSSCHQVRYSSSPQADLSLPIPMPPESAPAEGTAETEVPVPHVPLMRCLDEFSADEPIEFRCPNCNQTTVAFKRYRMETFPDTLVLHMKRFVYRDWVPRKLNVLVDLPDVLDLTPYQASGPRPDEHVLPDDSAPSAQAPQRQVDESVIEQLMVMGFPRIRCEKAVLETGNTGAEAAMNWLLEHLDDPDLDVPMPDAPAGQQSGGGGGGANVSEESVSMLADMGFTPAQARHALSQTDGNIDRAIEWLFSHPEFVADIAFPGGGTESGGGADGGGASAPGGSAATDGRPPRYVLQGLVTHKGTSVHCGHYVAHLRNPDDGRWILFNDNKVVAARQAPVGHAYLYFFRRVDSTSSS